MDNNLPEAANQRQNEFASRSASGFVKLEKVTTKTATSVSVTLDNIRQNIKLKHKRFHDLPEFMKIKGHDKPICLIGGGPSINNSKVQDELCDLYVDKDAPIIACGSSHDWLMSHGIIPTYTAVCDPDPISANYLKRIDKSTKFLISTGCDKKVFDLLADYQVYMWHCYSENYEEFKEIEPEFQAIGGGCTIGLRSINLAMMMGYTNIHLFGFDSCLADNGEHHAYSFVGEDEELGDIYNIKLGADSSGAKTYKCAGYQIAQVDHFYQLIKSHGNLFTPTIHGEGMLKDFYELHLQDLENVRKGVYTVEAQL